MTAAGSVTISVTCPAERAKWVATVISGAFGLPASFTDDHRSFTSESVGPRQTSSVETLLGEPPVPLTGEELRGHLTLREQRGRGLAVQPRPTLVEARLLGLLIRLFGLTHLSAGEFESYRQAWADAKDDLAAVCRGELEKVGVADNRERLDLVDDRGHDVGGDGVADTPVDDRVGRFVHESSPSLLGVDPSSVEGEGVASGSELRAHSSEAARAASGAHQSGHITVPPDAAHPGGI